MQVNVRRDVAVSGVGSSLGTFLKWRRTWPDDPGRTDWHISAGNRCARVYLMADGGRWYWCMNYLRPIASGTEIGREVAMAKAKAAWETTLEPVGGARE